MKTPRIKESFNASGVSTQSLRLLADFIIPSNEGTVCAHAGT
jgi:hypothetical protein